MQVPRYEDSQVKITPVSTPQAQAAPAGSFGEGIAKGMGDVAKVGFAYVAHEKAKQDAAMTDKGLVELIGAFDKNVSEASQVYGAGVKEGHGEDGQVQAGAPDLVTQYSTDFRNERAKIENGMSPDQKALFTPHADRYELHLNKTLMAHQVKQTEAWQTEQHATLASRHIKSLEVAPDNDSFKAGKNYLLRDYTNLYSTHGEDFILAEYEKKVAEIVDVRVKSAIARGDSATARQMFDSAVKDKDIAADSAAYSDLVHRLDGAEASDKGTAYIDKNWRVPANNAPVTDATTLYENIDKAVRSKQLTPEAGQIAEAELSQKITRYDHDRTVAIHTFKSDLWQGIDDKAYSLKSALAKVDAAAIPGDERVLLKKSVELYFKPPADPKAEMLQLLEQDSELSTLTESISNGKLRITSLKDAQGYTERIGRANVAKLYRFGSGYEKALASPVMAPAQFKTEIEILRQAGVPVPKTKASEYNAMQGYVLDELVQTQVKLGKMLSVEDQKLEIRKIISRKLPVFMSGGWFKMADTVYTEEKSPWNVQNSASVDVVGMLRKVLKREPTPEEIAENKALLDRPRRTRQQSKTFSNFGGN